MPIARPLSLILSAALVVSLSGCNNATTGEQAQDGDHGHDHGHDHDHGHRPESLHAAVAELTEMRDAIRDAILNGQPDDAHDPLHEVGDLLNAIPDLAAETDLPEEAWEAVDAAKEELFDAFGAIDKAFHTADGDKKAAYESVAEKLEQGIEAIRAKLPLTGEQPEADHDREDHDHDHADHDHNHTEEPAGEVTP